MKIHEILEKLSNFDNDNLIDFLFKNCLIKKEMNCEKCEVNMLLKK